MVTLWTLKICIWNNPSGKYPEPSSPSRISDGSCFCSTADVARSASDSTESSHPRGPRAALYYCCHSLRTKPALRESSVNHAIPSEPAGNRVNIRSKVLSDKTICLYKLRMCACFPIQLCFLHQVQNPPRPVFPPFGENHDLKKYLRLFNAATRGDSKLNADTA